MAARDDPADQKVRIGFFSFTEITDPTEHRVYNEWHQLDHLPEQYPLPGVAYGQRWVSTPACRDARLVDEDPLRVVHYMTLYLMTEPVDRTLEQFMELGQRLRDLGRFHQHRRSHLSGPLDVVAIRAAARVQISGSAVPFRPNLGVYVIVEEPAGRDETGAVELCQVPGVAGAWSFSADERHAEHAWRPGDRRITVCYLDAPPLEVAANMGGVLRRRWARSTEVRPLLAGPFETITPWQWDWFDSPGGP